MKCVQRFFRSWTGVVIFAASALMGPGLLAQQNTAELDVGVRTQVDPDAKFEKKIKGEPPAPRPRLYAILQVQLRPNQEELIKPVDAEMIAREVAHQLDLQGFQRVQPKQKPEIVITAEYGRGMLPNPYLGGASMIHDIQGDAPSVTLGVDALKQIMREKTAFVEQKIQKASYEKLFIEVKAWKYPSSPQEKPRVMWVAMMNVDDPDHRDLNTVFKDMLAAGAQYFDKSMEEPEVSVFKPLPEGTVKVGTPTVIEPTKPAKN
jgi:hypothetical protein